MSNKKNNHATAGTIQNFIKTKNTPVIITPQNECYYIVEGQRIPSEVFETAYPVPMQFNAGVDHQDYYFD